VLAGDPLVVPPAGGGNHALLEEYRFAAALTSRPVKITLLGPDYVLHALETGEGAGDNQTLRQRFDATLAFERRLLGEVVAAGCPYVQLDAPGYLAYWDPLCVAAMRGAGIDPVANLRWAMEADNALIEGIDGAVVALHMCRRHVRGRCSGQLADGYAELLFTGLAPTRLLIDCDPTDPYFFAPLRFLPRGKQVVLGVADSDRAQIESVDDILAMVERASHWVPPEDLALSPTCGFGPSVSAGRVSSDDQWRKLDVLLEAAARIWP
jgi:5-methyltetrahydropteroyltriglutamate--homocysteine methyltransferase